jgi:hypothetical protein
MLPGALKAVGIPGGADAVEAAAALLADHFSDHSLRLTRALQEANDRAWKALEITLAGESFWGWLDRAEDRALRRQVRAFLDALPREQLPVEEAAFRQQCLAELRAARRAGLLNGAPDLPLLAGRAADFARFADPRRLLEAEARVMQGLAADMAQHGYAHLARLLALRPDGTMPLLAVAVRYFFRRAVEQDAKLFQGLAWATWDGFGEAQERGFAQLQQALAEHGEELELRLDELLVYARQIHGAVLDIRQEQHQQGERHRELYEAVLGVQRRLEQLGQQRRPHDSLAAHDGAERQLLRAVLARYRALPPDQQAQLPALLDAVGRLQLRAGDADGARQTFATVSTVLTDRTARAEAHYHAHRAALRRQDWPKALASYRQAAALDPTTWTLARLQSELGDVLPSASPEAAANVRQALAQWHGEQQFP